MILKNASVFFNGHFKKLDIQTKSDSIKTISEINFDMISCNQVYLTKKLVEVDLKKYGFIE